MYDEQFDNLQDAVLVSMTRAGHDDAYAALYRRYSYGAIRLARHLGQREESDDIVAEAFARILDLLRRGKGPDEAFRGYLYTTIRHESGRRAKAERRTRPTDDVSAVDSAVPFDDRLLDGYEREVIRAAYESLPERWRTVLWHLEVEGRKPADVADVLGLSANGVSALGLRARAGLRVAYRLRQVA